MAGAYEESRWSWAHWLAEGSSPAPPTNQSATPNGSLDDRMPNPRGGDHDMPYVNYVDYFLSVRQTVALVRLRLLIESGRFHDDLRADDDRSPQAA